MYNDQLVYKVVIWAFWGISLWKEKETLIRYSKVFFLRSNLYIPSDHSFETYMKYTCRLTCHYMPLWLLYSVWFDQSCDHKCHLCAHQIEIDAWMKILFLKAHCIIITGNYNALWNSYVKKILSQVPNNTGESYMSINVIW